MDGRAFRSRRSDVEGLLDSRENLADPVDRATVESDRIWTLCIRDTESKLIKKTQSADRRGDQS